MAAARDAPSRLVDVADLLEAVGEYLCGCLQDGLALRLACSEYRRAVDTTVRRLVYADQPHLRASLEAPLRLPHSASGVASSLSALRAAVPDDKLPNIVRLAIVAFALDGAKNESREAASCGPRPVCFTPTGSGSCPAGLMFPPLPLPGKCPVRLRLEVAVARCLTEAVIDAGTLHCGTVLRAIEEMGENRPWRSIIRLRVVDRHPTAAHDDGRARIDIGLDPRSLTRLMRGIGSQLTHLRIQRDLIAFLVPWRGAAIADAIVDSGAALTHLDVEGMSSDDAMRVVESIPTIVDAFVGAGCGEQLIAGLSPAAAERLVTVNGKWWKHRVA